MRAAPRPARREAAFTLVEILVVLVIMAVLTTIAVLSMGVLGKDAGLDAEGDRYADVVAAALEQAGLEGRDYGIWFGADRYQVLAHDAVKDTWGAIAEDRLYELHVLPEGVTVAVEMEGRPVKQGSSDDTAPRVPQLLLGASGEASPYHLVLAREGYEAVWQADGAADGTITITRPGTGSQP